MTAFKTTTESLIVFEIMLLKDSHLSIVLYTFHVDIFSTKLYLQSFLFIFHFAVGKTSFYSGH